MAVRIKRAYDPPEKSDGFRILVDRVWPRGMTKEKLQADLWLRDIAPSTELRQWFGHDPAKWEEFRTRYRAELAAKPELIAQIAERVEAGPVTLVYGAKDTEHNQAVALRGFLESHPRRDER